MSRFEVRKSSLYDDVVLVALIVDAREVTLEEYELLDDAQTFKHIEVDICVKHAHGEIERLRHVVQSTCDAQDETSSD